MTAMTKRNDPRKTNDAPTAELARVCSAILVVRPERSNHSAHPAASIRATIDLTVLWRWIPRIRLGCRQSAAPLKAPTFTRQWLRFGSMRCRSRVN